jgi:hypothetical protein
MEELIELNFDNNHSQASAQCHLVKEAILPQRGIWWVVNESEPGFVP